MESFPGEDISVPMANKLIQKMDQLFDEMQKKCNVEVQRYLQRAAEERETMNDRIKDSEIITTF